MRRTIAFLAAAALAAGCGAGSSGAAANRFVSRIDNPWFPLLPGTVYDYRGIKDGQPSRDAVTVTHGTKTIQRVRATVVRDLLYVRGRLAERTSDYYAQDAHGNVWYYGEDTVELDARGRVVSREGSWRSGVNGARAGIYMPAHPRPGHGGRQEFYRGHAEDVFTVVTLNARVHVPAASSIHALLTRESTRLEPDVVDHKLYVRG